MRMLLTFAGVRDPFNPDELIAGQMTEGPVLALLREERFAWVYIFTDVRVLGNAQSLAGEIAQRYPTTKTQIIELNLPDPTDYETIFYQLNQHGRALLAKHATAQPHYWIATASGTPQMQTVWFLLAQSGILPATLLKVTPRRFLKPGEHAVSEIKLSLAEFPKITPGEVDTLELASLRRQKEQWEAEREAFFRAIEVEGIIGTSKVLQKAVTTAMKAAPSDRPVLILGESGTGKELFAKAIHRRSRRATRPLIIVNCAALPETLIESELFGYAPKSGIAEADRHGKPGHFELADGGTIFLDEIGDMSAASQAKVLRVLQDGEVQRLSATASRKVNVRLIAATNNDLRRRVMEGTFREDLYHRLHVIPLSLPPLRERREDIPLLIEHFLSRISRDEGGGKKLSRKALKLLLDYSWPGNVRELEHVIERMALLSEGEAITEEDIPQEIVCEMVVHSGRNLEVVIPPRGIDLDRHLGEWEKAYFQKAIAIKAGNQAAAARLLGLQPHTFRKRVREKFGLGGENEPEI